MKLWLTNEECDAVREAIDWKEWKHSWHLPTDHLGYTDWSHDDTLAKSREVLEEYRSASLAFAAKCDRLAVMIAGVQADRAKDREDELNERAKP